MVAKGVYTPLLACAHPSHGRQRGLHTTPCLHGGKTFHGRPTLSLGAWPNHKKNGAAFHGEYAYGFCNSRWILVVEGMNACDLDSFFPHEFVLLFSTASPSPK